MFKFKIGRTWRWPKVLITLLVVELGGTIAALALFGIADPNLFRTKMWQVGSDNGFNSSPNEILYAYANHVALPSIPFVWSHTLTSFNVAVAVLSMFVQLVKVIMFVMHIWYPLLGALTNLALTVLWIVSIYGQAGPDHSDPKHPSNQAWYITKSCSYAEPYGWSHYCMLAKATFAVSIIMMLIFAGNLILAIWSCIPTDAQRAQEKLEYDDMQDESPVSNKGLEMKSSVKLAAPSPYTPRTTAFNTLSGGSAFANRPLPLREQSSTEPLRSPGFGPRLQTPKTANFQLDVGR